MLALNALTSKTGDLERRVRALEATAAEMESKLEALRLESVPFEKWMEYEQKALMLLPASNAEEESEVGELANLLAAAQYEKIIYGSETAKFVFGKPVDGEQSSLDERIQKVIEDNPDTLGAHRIMFLGAALLQLFIQANYTGPPLSCLSDSEKYPLPYLPREAELIDENDMIAKLQQEARATAAATGKDKTVADLDLFPRTHAKCAAQLEINGEAVYDRLQGLHFLHVAVILLKAANSAVVNAPITCGWWSARVSTVWQENLQTRDESYDLKMEAETGFEKCHKRLSNYLDRYPTFPNREFLIGTLFLERGVTAHKFKDPAKAKQFFADALQTLDLSVKLSGAMGKRTKFQLEDKSQLVLLASSSRTKAPKESEVTTTEPRQDGEAAGFGTIVEAGHVRVRLDELDADQPLHERIQISDKTNEFERKGHLSEIDQVAILNLCIDVKNSYAMERLTAEEMLAYCERVTENPDNWTIHGCALLIKSKLEFERYKTKERSVLQMQLLVDQQTDRLTPLQYRVKDITDDSAPALDRLKYVHALVWPSVWRLKRGLADRYRELGVLGSALNIYQEMRMWEDAASCLVQMDKKHRAETLIRERLEIAPTPNLYVTLGELIEDESFLEKAWEFSNYRYARAKRLLGAKAYDRGDYELARTHLVAALNINAQFVWAWFRLGAAAMRLEDWATARKAYARVVSLEPDDAEGWANLSSCLVQVGEVEQAFRAIQEASKNGFTNSRIWDSYLTLALRAKEWDLAAHAMDHLIDLEGRKSGAPRVDVRALLPLTEHAITKTSFRPRYEALVAKIKAKCQSQADVWALVSEYYSAAGKPEERRDALIRRCRALITQPEWFKDIDAINRVVLTATSLCKTALDAETKVKRETSTFINSFIEKANNWTELPINDLEKKVLTEARFQALKSLLGDLNITA